MQRTDQMGSPLSTVACVTWWFVLLNVSNPSVVKAIQLALALTTVAELAKSDLKATFYAQVRSRTKCVEEGGSCSPNVFRLGKNVALIFVYQLY